MIYVPDIATVGNAGLVAYSRNIGAGLACFDKWQSWGEGFINEERWITFIATSPR
jgi:hypothetical protein